MKPKDFNEALNHLDDDIVEEYVVKAEKFEKNKSKKNYILLRRITALSASLALIIVSITVLMKYNEPFIPPPVPTWENAQYSAEDIATIFSSYKYESIATNAYSEIYVPDAKYLNINPISDKEYLEIYNLNVKGKDLNKTNFSVFINSIIPNLEQSIDIEFPKADIEYKEATSYSTEALTSESKKNGYRFYASQTPTLNRFSFYRSKIDGDHKIFLDNEVIQVDQRLSDEEILDSLESIKNKLFDIFGVSFTDARVTRTFTYNIDHGVRYLTVYFYNKDAHPLVSDFDFLSSDHISISFENFSNYDGDIVSDDFLTVANVDYFQNRVELSEIYTSIAKVRLITLEEAEALLYNGYVFGGHTCRLCMEAQEKISFEDYDFVEISYEFEYANNDSDKCLGIPFYAFYKKIKKSKDGNYTYAKTYVPAIEVYGLAEYFESQIDNHTDIDKQS